MKISKFKVAAFLAFKGFRQYAFSSLVASFTIAMAGGLFLSTWKIKEETKTEKIKEEKRQQQLKLNILQFLFGIQFRYW